MVENKKVVVKKENKKGLDFTNPKLIATGYKFPNGISFQVGANGEIKLFTSKGHNQFVFTHSSSETLRQFSKMFAEIARIADKSREK